MHKPFYSACVTIMVSHIAVELVAWIFGKYLVTEPFSLQCLEEKQKTRQNIFLTVVLLERGGCRNLFSKNASQNHTRFVKIAPDDFQPKANLFVHCFPLGKPTSTTLEVRVLFVSAADFYIGIFWFIQVMWETLNEL